MKSFQLYHFSRATILIIILQTSIAGIVYAGDPPFSITTGLFDQSKTYDLGLSKATGTETVSVFKPSASTNHFSNGAVMAAFKNRLYCMWQSSATSEDTPDTWVAYSWSDDGLTWSEPLVLAQTIANGYCSSGGWWATNDTLIGYINTWPANLSPRGGYTRYVASTDGLNWSEPAAVKMANGDTLKGIFEQDPHAIPGGRILNAAHLQPGLVISPIYTDDPTGIRGWVKAKYTNLSISSNVSREMEPSNFIQSDGTLVMIFRDQNSTFYKLASTSTDRGETWSTSVLTNMPDSRSKQCAGNLSDGTAYFASNPILTKSPRLPLVLTLSKDGKLFDTAYLLRAGGSDLQSQRYSGTSKGLGYSYPKSLVWKDHLYISYSTNKEDVEFTRVPLNTISLNSLSSVADLTTSQTDDPIKINVQQNKAIHIIQRSKEGLISIYNLNGQLIYRCKMEPNETVIDWNRLPSETCIIEAHTNSGRISKMINKR